MKESMAKLVIDEITEHGKNKETFPNLNKILYKYNPTFETDGNRQRISLQDDSAVVAEHILQSEPVTATTRIYIGFHDDELEKAQTYLNSEFSQFHDAKFEPREDHDWDWLNKEDE